MPLDTKSCGCSLTNWILIHTQRIDSLGTETIEWCKNCGTIKKSCTPNGATKERTLDYRIPERTPNLKLIKE